MSTRKVITVVLSLLTVMSLASCSSKENSSSSEKEVAGISANHTDTFNKLTRKEFEYKEETTNESGEIVEATTEGVNYIIEEPPSSPEDVIIGEIKDNFIKIDDYTDASNDTRDNMDLSKFGTDRTGLFQFLGDADSVPVYNALDDIFASHSDWDSRVFKREKGVENTEDYAWNIYTLSNGPVKIKIAIGNGVKYKVETN